MDSEVSVSVLGFGGTSRDGFGKTSRIPTAAVRYSSGDSNGFGDFSSGSTSAAEVMAAVVGIGSSNRVRQQRQQWIR